MLLSTVVTLGDAREAAELAAQIEQDPEAPEDERQQARRLVAGMPPVKTLQALGWVREGTEALKRGDTQGGRWLLDRALVALERDQPPVALSLPNGPLGALPWKVSTHSPLARRSAPALAATADSRLLALGEGQIVRVIEVATGQEVHALPLRGTWVRGLAFAPGASGPLGGTELAILAGDGTLRRWDLFTGREHQEDAGGAKELVGYVPAGPLLVTEEGVAVAEPKGERRLSFPGKLRGHSSAGHLLLEQGRRVVLRGPGKVAWSAPSEASVLLSPEGSWVAAGGPDGIDLTPLGEGGMARRLRARIPGPYRLAAASASGKRVLGEAGGQALLWEVESGEVAFREGWRAAGFVGETALLELDGRWALWRPGAKAPRELQERPGDRFREVFAVGPLLLTGGSHEMTYRIRDPESGAGLQAIDPLHAEALQVPAARGQEALAGVDPDGAVRLLWPERGEQAKLPAAGHLTAGVGFVGGKLAAFSEGQLRIFGAEDGRLLALRERPQVGSHFGAFGGAGTLATLGPHGWLQLFDVGAVQARRTLEGSKLPATLAVALSSDGRWVAVGERGGVVRVWDTERGGEPRLVLSDHRGNVQGATFVGASRLCSGDEAGEVICREIPEGAWEPMRPATPLGEVTGLAETAEGELLVVARSLLGVRVRVFDAARGKQLRSLGELVPVDGEGMAVQGGVLLAPSTISGSTLLLRVSDGAPLGALRVLRNGRGAYFLAPSGAVELLGTPLGGVGACRVGFRSFPAELCLDRFERPGSLRRALAGEVP
jgi:WD40 repeat protein